MCRCCFFFCIGVLVIRILLCYPVRSRNLGSPQKKKKKKKEVFSFGTSFCRVDATWLDRDGIDSFFPFLSFSWLVVGSYFFILILSDRLILFVRDRASRRSLSLGKYKSKGRNYVLFIVVVVPAGFWFLF